jgi:hypothetical protein
MARAPRTRTKPVEPEPAEEETNGAVGLREVGALHESMAEWYNAEYADELDKPLTPRQVQLVISKRNEYRKSDAYEQYVEERDAAAAEEEAKPKPARRAAKQAEEDPAPASKPAARSRRGKAAAPAAETEEPAAAPKARSRRRTAAAATEGEAAPAPAARTRRRRAASTATEGAAEPF